MNRNRIIIAVLAIVIIASAAFIYSYYYMQNSSQQAQQGISIVDDEGYTTVLPAVPQKIVSLAPSVTPILYQIGVGDKVVGVTKYDNAYYDFNAWFEAGNMTNVGGFSTPNMEVIATLKPDLIFSTDVNDATIPNMRELGYNVIVVNPRSVQGIFNAISMIGKATGAEGNAASLVNTLNAQVNNVEAKIAAANITEQPAVYYEVWCDNSGLTSAGATSWITDVIAKAGGVNIFGNESMDYPTTSSEVVVQKNPDVIILPTNMGSDTPSYGSVNDVKARGGWSTINAVRNNRVYVLDQNLLNLPGSRVGDQVEAIAACLYPQLFTSST